MEVRENTSENSFFFDKLSPNTFYTATLTTLYGIKKGESTTTNFKTGELLYLLLLES